MTRLLKYSLLFKNNVFLLAVSLLSISCAFAACERKGGKNATGVILIVMDTARAENFSCYGYHRPTSPNIDAFAEEASLYTNAMASSPWTVPTHASIFTGKDPFEHGSHRIDSLKTSEDEFANPLHESHTTLAEVFETKGFATGAFIANEAYVNERYQLDQGFQTFHTRHTTSDSINAMVYQWLDTLSTDRYFLFINYMDTHTPYNTKPRPGFLEKPAPDDKGQLRRQLFLIYMHPQPNHDEDKIRELQQKAVDQYDTAIANLDEQIGLLFKYLKEKGHYQQSMIVLTSDHGEAFGEHDLVSHGKDVFQQQLWVPLVIKDPDQTKSRRIKALSSTSDIPHIIFSQFPQDFLRTDISDFPNIPGEHPVIAENYFAHPAVLKMNPWERNFDRIRTTIFDWPHKYIHSSDDKHELYNLTSDTGEMTNLIMDKPDLARKLADILEDFQTSRPRFDGITSQERLTEEEIKKLKALGYLGD
jgi:arylsulfatase A-like enzyme